MSFLVIGPAEEEAIARALDRARANVIPWARMEAYATARQGPLSLKDRAPGLERPDSEHIMLGTYRAAISFEEQPAGIMRHLSVSSANPDKIPGPHVMGMVCDAFGFSEGLCKSIGNVPASATPDRPFRVWLEEFDPGHMAVNVIELADEAD